MRTDYEFGPHVRQFFLFPLRFLFFTLFIYFCFIRYGNILFPLVLMAEIFINFVLCVFFFFLFLNSTLPIIVHSFSLSNYTLFHLKIFVYVCCVFSRCLTVFFFQLVLFSFSFSVTHTNTQRENVSGCFSL